MCLFIIGAGSHVYAQFSEDHQKQIDSLNHIIKNSSNDGAKAIAYVGLSEILYVSNIDTVIPLCAKAIELIDNIFNSATGEKKIFLLNTKALALNNIGFVYDKYGDINKALEYYLKGLKIREEIGDKYGIAESLNNIGAINRNQGDINKALEYYFKSLLIYEAIGDKKGLANSLNNIGVGYMEQGDIGNALEYYFKSLKIKEELDDKMEMVNTLNNIGGIYWSQDSTKKALEFYDKSFKIAEEIGDKNGMATSLNGASRIELEQNNILKAKKLAVKSMELAQELGFPAIIKNAANLLYEINIVQNNWKDAFSMYELYIQMRDNLSNEETRKAFIQKQLQYDYEKKEADIKAEQEKERAVATTESKRQRLFLILVGVAAAAAAVIAFIVFRSLRITRRQKQIIEIKSKETEEQKKLIEEKNKDITDSIEYAKKIQEAILPYVENIQSLMPQSFVLFKPKDIVSGDFYWLSEKKDKTLLIAADCTGHGVPGAFMSMISTSLLNEIVNEKGITKPSEVFFEVRKGIISAMKQTGESGKQKDGMDAVLCAFYKNKLMMEYAGANNPLFLVRNKNNTPLTIYSDAGNPETFEPDITHNDAHLYEIKPDKQPVGYYTETQMSFTNHKVKLEKGDTIYLISDGFQDQFGGPKGKKFMIKRLKETWLSIQGNTMAEQKQILNNTFEEWKAYIDPEGNHYEQVDDICLIGLRV